MILQNLTDFNLYIDKLYIDDVDLVEISDYIKISKENFNRIDSIILSKYDNLELLPLILSFNNLPDITNIPIGTIFKLPNLESLFTNLQILPDNENDIVQGVVDLIPNINSLIKTNNNITIASPKLNIALKKVSYDAEKGIITY